MVNVGKTTEPGNKGIDDGLADGCMTPGNGWKYDPTGNDGKTMEPAKKKAHKSTKKTPACARARARALGH